MPEIAETAGRPESFGRLESADRPVLPAILRGLRRRCPACGGGRCLRAYLKAADCDHCGAPLGAIRADDLPPYVTIFLVGHIVVPLALMLERTSAPPFWLQMTLWPTVTAALTLLLLPYVKGGAIGLLWALGLRGDERQ
ncbi:MAG: DUF983 domain-containing protein [Alphaproteobacteria bacterium]